MARVNRAIELLSQDQPVYSTVVTRLCYEGGREQAETWADCLIVDPTTLRNLEVIEAADGGRTGSLLHEIDRTITPMGGRLLRAWLRSRAACAAEAGRGHRSQRSRLQPLRSSRRDTSRAYPESST